MIDLVEIGCRAKEAASQLATLLSKDKDSALLAIASQLEQNCVQLLEANALDMNAASSSGIGAAMRDRLHLNEERVFAIAAAVREIAALDDPVGKVLGGERRPNGLQITKISVPVGIVGIIFESRPNVTVDCAALCLKAGNACILRGGKEAIRSNMALVSCIRQALEQSGLNPDSVQLVEDTSRESATEMMHMNGVIDLLIPRGGAGLIAAVVENASVPVIETGAGNCHIYVDESADLDMALEIVNNAKTSRPSVCNALETLLVHQACAQAFLPYIAGRLRESHVELRGCPRVLAILGDRAVAASETDWETEYDDYILAIKVVDGIGDAINHIERYSTHHSEAIVTADYAAAQRFTSQVDSAAVYVNASTRFTDGGEFGMGAEIGISTQKLHARGPMGLSHLTSYKYIIYGDGQIR